MKRATEVVQRIMIWGTAISMGLGVLSGGFLWAWNAHNEFLMEMISPLLRSSYATRINNYRRMECMGPLNETVRQAYEQALIDYEDLVGRPIGDRGCDTL